MNSKKFKVIDTKHGSSQRMFQTWSSEGTDHLCKERETEVKLEKTKYTISLKLYWDEIQRNIFLKYIKLVL